MVNCRRHKRTGQNREDMTKEEKTEKDMGRHERRRPEMREQRD